MTNVPRPNTVALTSVPDIWFKAKRVIRTVIQVIISAALLWGTIALVAPQILTELAKILPGSWIAWLTAALAFLGVVAGVITRIMAIPQVNAWLVKIGLGSVPASSLLPARVDSAGVAKITSLDDPTQPVGD